MNFFYYNLVACWSLNNNNFNDLIVFDSFIIAKLLRFIQES